MSRAPSLRRPRARAMPSGASALMLTVQLVLAHGFRLGGVASPSAVGDEARLAAPPPQREVGDGERPATPQPTLGATEAEGSGAGPTSQRGEDLAGRSTGLGWARARLWGCWHLLREAFGSIGQRLADLLLKVRRLFSRHDDGEEAGGETIVLLPELAGGVEWGPAGSIECYGVSTEFAEMRMVTAERREIAAVRPVSCDWAKDLGEGPAVVRELIGAPVLAALAQDQLSCTSSFGGVRVRFECFRSPGLLVVRVSSAVDGAGWHDDYQFRFPAPFEAALTLRAWLTPTPSPLFAMHDFVEGLALPPGSRRHYPRIAERFRSALADGAEAGSVVGEAVREFVLGMANLTSGEAANASFAAAAMRVAATAAVELSSPTLLGRLDMEDAIQEMAPVMAPAA